jgi:hypothetical protein
MALRCWSISKATLHYLLFPLWCFRHPDDQDDIRHSYLLGASSYFVKPVDPIELRDLLYRIHGYWKDSHVPQVDVEGYAIETSSKGKVGERVYQAQAADKRPVLGSAL